MAEYSEIKASPAEQAKRLAVIVNESGMPTREFCRQIHISASILYKILDGSQPLGLKVIMGVCYKLGYSPDWLLAGLGPKKPGKDTKIITDIQQFMVELKVERAQIKILKSQVEYLYKELESLKK